MINGALPRDRPTNSHKKTFSRLEKSLPEKIEEGLRESALSKFLGNFFSATTSSLFLEPNNFYCCVERSITARIFPLFPYFREKKRKKSHGKKMNARLFLRLGKGEGRRWDLKLRQKRRRTRSPSFPVFSFSFVVAILNNQSRSKLGERKRRRETNWGLQSGTGKSLEVIFGKEVRLTFLLPEEGNSLLCTNLIRSAFWQENFCRRSQFSPFPPPLETFLSTTTHISDDGRRHFFTSHSSPFLPAQFQLRGKKRETAISQTVGGEKKGGPLKMEKNPSPFEVRATSSVFPTLEEAFFSRPTSFCFSLGNRCQPLSLLFARMRLRRRLERLFYGRLSFFLLPPPVLFLFGKTRVAAAVKTPNLPRNYTVFVCEGERWGVRIRTQHTCSPLPPPLPTSNPPT